MSLAFIAFSLVLTAIQLVRYSTQRAYYPPELNIAGVPVGGLDPQGARDRLLQVYTTPVELLYGESVILMDPALVGFELDFDSMLAAADMQRTGTSFWGGFWDFLWNRTSDSTNVPLVSNSPDERLRLYLVEEIASRYDTPPTPAQALPGSTTFLPGAPGITLDIERAIILIQDALASPNNRTVILSSRDEAASRPSIDTLQLLLESLIEKEGFDGILGLYMLNLQTGEEIHFGLSNGYLVPVNPDIAFTAASTIKIPIMVSVYKFYNGELEEPTKNLLIEMIKQSDNPPADQLMSLLDPNAGPLLVSEDMRTLNLENTFLAGFFCDVFNPCPLLAEYSTPANQRMDINTYPDVYSQTTPSEMGMLLEDLYLCATTGGGALVMSFPGQIDQVACQDMINLLTEDKIGVLIQAGVPEGTTVAHKHGWVTDVATGIMYNVSDAAIVYSPGGDFILSMYVYHPIQINWEMVSRLFAEIAQAVYNYINLPGN